MKKEALIAWLEDLEAAGIIQLTDVGEAIARLSKKQATHEDRVTISALDTALAVLKATAHHRGFNKVQTRILIKEKLPQLLQVLKEHFEAVAREYREKEER